MFLQTSTVVAFPIAKRNIFITAPVLKRIYKYPKLVANEILQHPHEELKDEDELLNSLKQKLVYNSVVAGRNNSVRWRIRHENIKMKNKQHTTPVVPYSLKYAYNASQLDYEEYKMAYILESSDRESDSVPSNKDDSNAANFPYNIVQKIEFLPESNAPDVPCNSNKSKFKMEDLNPSKFTKNWKSDYEVFEEFDHDTVDSHVSEYGSADPHVLPSKIPCGGCGAHIQCQSSSIPGFLPKELFLRCSENDLAHLVCQRCTFLKQFNVALSVNVDPESYPKLLSCIKKENALVIILVDMMDFPCSIWPNLLNIIGRKTPIILVGNKVDLLPGDSPGWLHHAQKVLLKSFPPGANLLHVALISAKTGFGVEQLITKIQTLWQTQGNVYLVGCTNVGKSSLFNDLLQSDFCKIEAVDLIQRATVSPWPGTTLNLLKFPILRMNAWRSFLRTNRLKEERRLAIEEKELEDLQAEAFNEKSNVLPKIIGLIGRSFSKHNESEKSDGDSFTMPTITRKFLNQEKEIFNPNAANFQLSKWCYDTPGVVHRDQIINILTTEELMKTLPQKVIVPRIYSIYPKQSLLIGGLARIDCVDCNAKMARLVVYASHCLPVTVCFTEFVDEVYSTLLGSKYFAVPSGNTSRLEEWPALKSVKDFEFVGKGHAVCLSDIILSSAGWVSPVAGFNIKFTLRPFTPDGRGIFHRDPPLLRFTAKFRRRRVCNTPTYYMSHAR